MFILHLNARIIKDSRGEDTIEVSANGERASSPSGKSTGTYESLPYHKGIAWNVGVINSLYIPYPFETVSDLERLEHFLMAVFGLKRVQDFGGNALYALESAILKALAKKQGKALWQLFTARARMPCPVANVIGGGLHSQTFKQHPTFQEFLLIPRNPIVRESTQTLLQIHAALGKALKSPGVNDEGAWQTSLSEEEVLALLSKYSQWAVSGVDVAASSFYEDGMYLYRDGKRSKKTQITYINALISKYDLFYVEDPLNEEDFSGFSQVGKKYLVVGDDLTATHYARVQKAIQKKAINAMILKPNQNGSLLELWKIARLCKEHRIATVVSHRSGETMDDALADYAVGLGADYIKCGIATKWRQCKLARLIEIEKSVK